MYKSAITEPAYKRCAANLKSLRDLMGEILDELETMKDRGITRQELKRDFDFTDKGIDLFRETVLLRENSSGKKSRVSYSAVQVIKFKLHFPGFIDPKVRKLTTKNERKSSKVIRVIRSKCK